METLKMEYEIRQEDPTEYCPWHCQITMDSTQKLGVIKPMHAINNMPTVPRSAWNLNQTYADARIPYARLHDTGGAYGGGCYVDIPNIFRDFDADENDPASYDFAFTDVLLQEMEKVHVKPYYRLGITIENYVDIRTYRVNPPKDPAKWARICEHIVRHYNEGWANGFHYGIEYWEIWNEPDNQPEPKQNPMWSGTPEQFFELYDVTAKHLKACFPHIKVGGYASCGFYAITQTHASVANSSTRTDYFITFFEQFFAYIKEKGSPIDFFSWHSYGSYLDNRIYANYAKQRLVEFGYGDLEIHFNEWNAGPGDRGKAIDAAKVAAQMIDMQHLPVDMCMYYDGAMRSSYCGLFDPVSHQPFKTYSAFLYFGKLYRLGTEIAVNVEGDRVVFALAATDGKETAILLANISGQPVSVTLPEGPWKLNATDVNAIREERGIQWGRLVLPADAVWLLVR